MKIKDLPRIDRPREKLIKYGPEKLSNSELLAILLRTGQKDINVVELSKKILKQFSGSKLANVSYQELRKVSGLGAAKSCEIIACFELGRRFLKDKQSEMYLSPQEVWQELKDLRNHKKEHFVIFFLDTKNQEIRREIISVGTLNASIVHPREVFEPAITASASQIIIAHNHPSGNLEPSEEDIEVTRQLIQAGKILGINLLDHVIVSSSHYYSFQNDYSTLF